MATGLNVLQRMTCGHVTVPQRLRELMGVVGRDKRGERRGRWHLHCLASQHDTKREPGFSVVRADAALGASARHECDHLAAR
jgi:hypothetical protein